ncbi:MAG: 2-amino-4-hydroxy-6-hydroxymethyldihydropteridine diphosphokinase, partial [Geminicoccaceae bacterium]
MPTSHNAQRAVVALGANLGDRRATLERAVTLMAGLGEVAARSGWLETPALIHPDDPAKSYPEFLN